MSTSTVYPPLDPLVPQHAVYTTVVVDPTIAYDIAQIHTVDYEIKPNMLVFTTNFTNGQDDANGIFGTVTKRRRVEYGAKAFGNLFKFDTRQISDKVQLRFVGVSHSGVVDGRTVKSNPISAGGLSVIVSGAVSVMCDPVDFKGAEIGDYVGYLAAQTDCAFFDTDLQFRPAKLFYLPPQYDPLRGHGSSRALAGGPTLRGLPEARVEDPARKDTTKYITEAAAAKPAAVNSMATLTAHFTGLPMSARYELIKHTVQTMFVRPNLLRGKFKDRHWSEVFDYDSDLFCWIPMLFAASSAQQFGFLLKRVTLLNKMDKPFQDSSMTKEAYAKAHPAVADLLRGTIISPAKRTAKKYGYDVVKDTTFQTELQKLHDKAATTGQIATTDMATIIDTLNNDTLAADIRSGATDVSSAAWEKNTYFTPYTMWGPNRGGLDLVKTFGAADSANDAAMYYKGRPHLSHPTVFGKLLSVPEANGKIGEVRVQLLTRTVE